MTNHALRVDLPPDRALDLVAEAAADWGGEWRSEGDLHDLWLPAMAGLRRGIVAARVEAAADGTGTRLELTETAAELRLNRGAAGVMAFGALGGVVAMLWPFFPDLLRVAPIAAVLAVVAWLMVAGRLRNSGLEEFVASLEATASDLSAEAPRRG